MLADELKRLDGLVQMAEDLWDEGYTRIDADVPGVVRWHSIHGADEHPPKTVPLEVWFYIRGAFFGIGDHLQSERQARQRA